ncbi:hypothetical protein GE061_011570 [Apolygus lucorum]|uniref:Uncharacterized protein n=1 Tax=Apolygus lucorum TaxID=248454 RepID=A0A8S9Y0J0_APOLU|nr:hypothetical protein GE061_011570 [Apolygus lucorum]
MEGLRLRNAEVLPPRKEEGGGDAVRMSVCSGGSARTSSSKSSMLSKIELLRALDKQQEEARARMRAQEDRIQELKEQLMRNLETRIRSSRSSRKSETSRAEEDYPKMQRASVETQVEPLPRVIEKPYKVSVPAVQNHVEEIMDIEVEDGDQDLTRDQVALTGDIQEMYPQILLAHAQFLWNGRSMGKGPTITERSVVKEQKPIGRGVE